MKNSAKQMPHELATSPDRWTFFSETELWDLERDKEKSPEWKKNNLEYDLRASEFIVQKCRNSEVYAQNVYAALCNNAWLKEGETHPYTCSWRHAGGIVADLVGKGDYIDWYCSGILAEPPFVVESKVTEEIIADFKSIGWKLITV